MIGPPNTAGVLADYLQAFARLPRPPMGRRVVYTVLFGGSDVLKPVPPSRADWSFVCVTDREQGDWRGWTPILVPSVYRDARRTARLFKLLPWVVAPEAEMSLFLDASVEVTGSLEGFIGKECAGSAIACFPHPYRDCLYREGEACVQHARDVEDLIRAQLQRYRAEGFPDHQGLISSGIMYRDHRVEDVRRLMTLWIEELDAGSVRDQLSFNYACWKLGVGYRALPLDIYSNPYFEVRPHRAYLRYDQGGRDVAGLREKLWYRLVAVKSRLAAVQRRARRWARELSVSRERGK